MLRRLYDWTLSLGMRREAMWALAIIAFIESSFFPIPPDVLLIPMVLAARDRAFVMAGVATAASVLGGLAGYGIGYFLWETVGERLVAFYSWQAQMEEFAGAYNDWGAWIVLFFGITPFPYKLITIMSGVVALDLWVFLAASLVARGIRFYAVATLLWWFGPPIRGFIERRFGLVVTIFMVLLIGGFAAALYLA
ncbi:MAG: YqaA family protein [Azospirillaceae bacterium]